MPLDQMSLSQLRGNMPLSEAAFKLGISKSYLSLIENGKRRLSLELAEKMSKLYKVSIDAILRAYKVYRMSTDKINFNNKYDHSRFKETGTG